VQRVVELDGVAEDLPRLDVTAARTHAIGEIREERDVPREQRGVARPLRVVQEMRLLGETDALQSLARLLHARLAAAVRQVDEPRPEPLQKAEDGELVVGVAEDEQIRGAGPEIERSPRRAGRWGRTCHAGKVGRS
jgi:hypothetical protein